MNIGKTVKTVIARPTTPVPLPVPEPEKVPVGA